MGLEKIIRGAAAAALAVGLGAAPAVAQQEAEVRETHGEWGVVCVEDRCSMQQTNVNSENQPVLQMSLRKLPEPQRTDTGTVVAMMQITMPLGILLPSGLGVRIDNGEVRFTPVITCVPIGCISRVPVPEDLVAEFKNGGQVDFLTELDTTEGRRVVTTSISLSGFTAAFDAL